jgi:flavin-dependent dehydrogenase
MERRPIVIVGSGPAGTATALHLLRRDGALAGETLLLEKAHHPRPKVCAGGVIPAAIEALRELDLTLAVPHVVVHRAVVQTPRHTVRHDDRNLCSIVRRAEFDASLADACRQRGVTLREDEAVLDARRDGDGVRLVTSRAEIHTRLVVAADGSGSVIRRRLVGAGKQHTARAIMCDVPAAAARWPGLQESRYDFDFRCVAEGVPGYRWVFPCLIGGVPHLNIGAYTLHPIGTRLDDALHEYLAELGASPVRWQAFPIHWYAPGARLAGPHVLLTGDAAGADPLMGEGISLALEYGRHAAAAAVAAWHDGDFSGAAYERAIRRSWFGRKLGRLHLGARLFYGRAWPLWFAIAAGSQRLQAIGLKWYNGVDGWDRRSGWAALAAVACNTVSARSTAGTS